MIGSGGGAGEREMEGVGCRESIRIFGCLYLVEQWLKEEREGGIKITGETNE